MSGFKYILCVSFADGVTILLLCILYFFVLASLYYTLYLLRHGMNQQVYMNPLMNYIYRAEVLEFS